jgi:hypothetical protein
LARLIITCKYGAHVIDILRDAIWQAIGAILALIALFASIWFYLKQKE